MLGMLQSAYLHFQKIRSRPNKYFIFSIDTGKKSVTLGWGEIPIVPLKTHGQKQKYECNQHRSRPLFLDWGLEEIFKQCDH